MSDELTLEEIAEIFHNVWLHADQQGEQETRVMAYIAALRAKVEALQTCIEDRDRDIIKQAQAALRGEPGGG